MARRKKDRSIVIDLSKIITPKEVLQKPQRPVPFDVFKTDNNFEAIINVVAKNNRHTSLKIKPKLSQSDQSLPAVVKSARTNIRRRNK